MSTPPPSPPDPPQRLNRPPSDFRAQIQDPLVLMDPASLTEALLDWLPTLERALGPGAEKWDGEGSGPEGAPPALEESLAEEDGKENTDGPGGNGGTGSAASNGSPPEPVRLEPPRPVQEDLLADLTQLATLYAELSCFRKLGGERATACSAFLRRYFFLLDQERVRRMCLLSRHDQPELQASFAAAMLGKNPPRPALAAAGKKKKSRGARPDVGLPSPQAPPGPAGWWRSSTEGTCSGPCAA